MQTLQTIRHIFAIVSLAFFASTNAAIGQTNPGLEPREIRLRNRQFTPPAGVDPGLRGAIRTAASLRQKSLTLILQFGPPPSIETWRRLESLGLSQLSHLGDGNFIVHLGLPSRITLESLSQQLRLNGLTSITFFQPADKVAPVIARGGPFEAWALDQASGLLRVVATFSPKAPPTEITAAIRAVHRGTEAITQLGTATWAIRLIPSNALRLANSEHLLNIELGPIPQLPLLNDARANTGVDGPHSIDISGAGSPFANGLSGKNIKLSTAERFADHDDFWNHDITGARTSKRWNGNCVPGVSPNGHGDMTAGIALGNGFMSILHGGYSYQWRGIAPDAIFTCPGNEDIVSRSFVMTYGAYDYLATQVDSNIRGDNGGDRKPQVWAVANQGITSQYGTEVGYFSVYAPAKNPVVVANLSADTLRWVDSSVGPTWDGRLKPDLGAPGFKRRFPEDKPQLMLDLDYLSLKAQGGNFDWTFNGSGASWHGGMGQACPGTVSWCTGTGAWWTATELGSINKLAGSLNVPLLRARSNKVGTVTQPDGTTALNITGALGDVVEFRYRVETNSRWRPGQGRFGWSNDAPNYKFFEMDFPVIADGAWHVVTLPIGNHPNWKQTGTHVIYVSFQGPGMMAATPGNRYNWATGSSAAAPGVAGMLALLMEKLNQQFGVNVSDRTGFSPFWFGAPGTALPLPSTLKALLIHGARDLAYIPYADEPDNPDTGSKTIYHDGPDFVTGYGIPDVSASLSVLTAHSASTPSVVERSINNANVHQYSISVPTSPSAPLKVVLAWDDPAGNPLFANTASKLVNDLDLSLKSPTGKIYYPYSLDSPNSLVDPGSVEPELISATSIKRARQDQRNSLDNVEAILVTHPEPGTWTATVRGYQLWQGPQKYSLILRSKPLTATHLNGGKVVFASNRVNPPQLFVKSVDSTSLPTQLTSGSFAARHPQWSPNGKFVAYLTTDVITPINGNSTQVDVLRVDSETGAYQVQVPSLKIGGTSLGYPQWSPDGKKIVITYWYNWGARGLAIISFPSSTSFSGSTIATILHPGGSLNAAEAAFSTDNIWIYFTADSAGSSSHLWRMRTDGSGAPEPVYGNGLPVRRSFSPSVAPDATRILLNSEMWKEDPNEYKDEEVLELGLQTGVAAKVTYEAGNQTARYAKNGAGEMVIQSDTAVGTNANIWLGENGVRIPLDIGDSANTWSDTAPDWWKAPCQGGTVLWKGGVAVGCKFSSWGPDQKSTCGAWTPLVATGTGSCHLCIDAELKEDVLAGNWGSLTEGPDPISSTPASLSCRGCFLAPAQLLGWWTLDETTGTTATDRSTTAAHGSFVGTPVPSTGRVASGLKFNGSNDFVEVPANPALNVGTSDLTIDGWVNIASPSDILGVKVIIEKRQDSPFRGYSLFLYNGAIGVQLADGSYTNFTSSGKVPADGAWHHIAVTVDRDQPQGGRFYLDGAEIGTFNPTARQASLSNNAPLRIGSVSLSSPGSLFKGILDEIELHSRSLTSYEVQLIYLAGPCGKCK